MLVDSGAEESLMAWSFADWMRIKTQPLTQPVKANALDGSFIFNVLEPVAFCIEDHHELITFHLFHSGQYPLILGFPWLKRDTTPTLTGVQGRL